MATARTASANLAATASLTLGCMLTGLAVDRFGLRRVAPVAAASIALGGYLLLGGGVTSGTILAVYAVVGLLAGALATVPAFMVRAFPPAIAFSGVSLAYNVAYALAGGLTPPLVISLGRLHPLFPAHYVALASLAGATGMTLALQTGRPRPSNAEPRS